MAHEIDADHVSVENVYPKT